MTRVRDPLFAWGSALIVSLLAHAMLLAMLEIATKPSPVPFTETVERRLQMAALEVPSDRAVAQNAEGEVASEAASGGERLGVQAVPTSRAEPVAAEGQSLAAVTPEEPVTGAVAPAGEHLATASVAEAALEASALPSQVTAAARPASQALAASPTSAAKVLAQSVESPRLADAVVATALIEAAPAAATVLGASERPGVTMAAAAPLVTVSQSATLPAASVTAATSAGPVVASIAPEGPAVAALSGAGQDVASSAPDGETVLSSAPEAEALASSLPERAAVASSAPGGEAVASSAPVGVAVVSSVPEGAAVASSAPEGEAVMPSVPEGAAVVPSASADLAAALPATNPQSTALAMAAALAWSGETNTVLDEKSLATIQSFMRQGALAESESFAGSARDQIGATLAQFPCSRLQAAFQPESGGLEVRGHVPAEGLRGEVVELLTQSVGGAIPIGGSLLVLPAPQCGILGSLETLGLPQSNDQAGDPLVIGREAQAAILEMEEAQLVTFQLQAPEFDAFVYIDYYDKDGNVVHVLPNEFDAQNHWLADQPFKVGGTVEEGAKFQMRIAPPFGQDIAVVLGSSEPLYQEIRPLVEQAVDYLAWLRQRIETLKSAGTGFHGEWAYLFVKTGPKGAFAGE